MLQKLQAFKSSKHFLHSSEVSSTVKSLNVSTEATNQKPEIWCVRKAEIKVIQVLAFLSTHGNNSGNNSQISTEEMIQKSLQNIFLNWKFF